MSYHKARPEEDRPDPNKPSSSVMRSGRIASPHAEVEGEPIQGGLENAVVEGVGRTPEEEKAKVKEYHVKREAVKKAQATQFNPKTGEPKVDPVKFLPDPEGDAHSAPDGGTSAPPEEVKKNVEAEKKTLSKTEEKKK